MKGLIDKGGFNVRDWCGSRFRRLHEPGTPRRDVYNQCKTYKAKAEFRLDWLKKAYETRLSEKTTIKAWTEVNRHHGRYLDFGVVVEQFGIHFSRERAIAKAGRFFGL